MSTEHERIATLATIYARSHADVAVGIGDDCAVLLPSAGQEVWTIDAAVENVHFRRDLMSLDAIGYRAFMAAASDVAAMGAHARAALSSLVLPASMTDEELYELARGTARAADECRCSVAGGNLARGKELSITTTVLGACLKGPIARSGAKPGDDLFVTGPLGGSALGLRLLDARDQSPKSKAFVDTFLFPRARFDVAEKIAALATSAIDISDGLAQDAAHIARASQVRLEFELAKIPKAIGFEDCAKALQLDPAVLILGGGEDYEILFSAPPSFGVDGWATHVGRVCSGDPRVVVRDEHNREVDLNNLGFDHFAPSRNA